MELDKIRELIRLVEDSQIQELELSNRGETIRISKAASAAAAAHPAPMVVPVAGGLPATLARPPSSPVAVEAAPPATPAPARSGESLREIASPMVGTFYRAPSPDADPYVRVGDRIDKGDVVCIVEAMKLMNEIESEIGGVVREILVENAQPVEFGQPLFLVDTSA
jgi:acetyl-CoA carboxylase biotin carboxyl carrier protein